MWGGVGEKNEMWGPGSVKYSSPPPLRISNGIALTQNAIKIFRSCMQTDISDDVHKVFCDNCEEIIINVNQIRNVFLLKNKPRRVWFWRIFC